MAKKYYAVKKGRTPGIYLTFEDCRAQVEQFSGAVYKGFDEITEAEQFLCGSEQELECNKLPVSTNEHLIAYVDGSYDHSQRRYAYGCVLVFEGETIDLNGSDDREEYVEMRNVAGEIMGSQQAISWAQEHGYRKITIYYDYEGIEKWANGAWKTNKTGTKAYKEFIKKSREDIEISFCKVAAHTGDTYNEKADKLAKEALGL